MSASLVDPKGNVIVDALVQIVSHTHVFQTRSNDQGVFVVPGVEIPSVGHLRIAAEPGDGLRTTLFSLRREWNPPPRLTVQRSPVVSVRIETRPLLEQGTVEVFRSDEPSNEVLVQGELEDGAFLAALEEGDFELLLRDGNGARLARKAVSVTSAPAQTLFVPWKTELAIRGRVVRASDRTPLARARVALSSPASATIAGIQASDAEGAFQRSP